MKKFPLISFMLMTRLLVAQSYEELSLLYARPSTTGTARSIGAGGAFGSVGADLGCVGINPAGLGLYRSSDFSVTPALLISMNETKFNGSVINNTLPRVSIAQAGGAFTKVLKSAQKKDDFSFSSTRFVAFTFAINYQRQAFFSRDQTLDGRNTVNSGMEFEAYNVNTIGLPLSTDNYPIETVLGYEGYLIDLDTVSGSYFSNVHAPVRQSGSMNTRGAIDEVNASFGGNVSDKFYFGVGLAVSILNFQRTSHFSESDPDNASPSFTDYTFSSQLRQSGLGVNAKFGIIYRPVSWMRLGVAYHIPTYYNLTENYAANMTANFDSFYYNQDAQSLPLKIKTHTPMKGVVSASFYFKENGFFSLDYEFLNYGSTRYNFGSDYKTFSQQVNASVKENYTFGHVIRAGIEGAYKRLRVRGGYTLATTPFKKDKVVKGYGEWRHQGSIGLGYRSNRFYIDGAYLFGFMRDASYPYADFELKNTQLSHQVFITVGWKINKDLARSSRTESPQQDF